MQPRSGRLIGADSAVAEPFSTRETRLWLQEERALRNRFPARMIATAALFASLSLGAQHAISPREPFGTLGNATYWAFYLTLSLTSAIFLHVTGRRSEDATLLDLGRLELGYALIVFGTLLLMCIADLSKSLDLSAHIMAGVALCVVMRVAARVQVLAIASSMVLLATYLGLAGKAWALSGIVDGIVFGGLILLVGLGLEREFRRMMSYKLTVATQTQQLRDVSVRDPAIGLYGPRYARIFIEQQMQKAIRQRYPLSVIAVSIDGWKCLAEEQAFADSEAVQRSVSELLSNGVRQTDVAALLEDESFLLVLPATSRVGSLSAAERFRRRVERLRVPEAEPLSASFGLAQWNGEEGMDALLERAADRLRQASAAGGNRVIT